MKPVKKLFFGYKDVLDFKDVLMKVVKSLIECTPCIQDVTDFNNISFSQLKQVKT